MTNLADSETSYFVPVKVERTPVLFLLDTGLSINVLSKRKFDQLLPNVKQALTPVEISGTLTDGLKLQFLGRIVASGRLRQVPFEAVFYVKDIKQDAILKMGFSTHINCGFSFAIFKLKPEELKCVNRDNSLLITSCHAERQFTEGWGGDYYVLSTL